MMTTSGVIARATTAATIKPASPIMSRPSRNVAPVVQAVLSQHALAKSRYSAVTPITGMRSNPPAWQSCDSLSPRAFRRPIQHAGSRVGTETGDTVGAEAIDLMADEEASEDGVEDRLQVQPFSRSLIQRYLDGAELTYLVDMQGDFRVDFAYDDEIAAAVSFWLMASGREGEIYGIEARSTRRFSRDSWEWCLYVVNEWNKRMRYPKAYLYVPDEEQGKTGEIRLEQYTDLEHGAHQELVDSLTATVMGGAMRFWSWLREQYLQYTLARNSDDKLDG